MPISTTTTIVAAPNPARLGQSVHIQATVTPTTGGPPTGTVQFYDNASPLGAPVALIAGVADLFHTYTLSTDVGTHSYTATYTADPAWVGGTTATPFLEDILRYLTSVSLTSDENPSQYEDEVMFTVSITGVAASPTGSVGLYDGANLLVSLLAVPGTAPMSSIQYTTNSLTAGMHPMTAMYAGDSSYEGNSSIVYSQDVLAVTVPLTVLPSFSLVSSYTTQGDTSLPPSAILYNVPVTAQTGSSVTLLWTTTNVAAVEIFGNNGVDPLFNTGVLTTNGSGAFVKSTGWTRTIVLTMSCYDAMGHLLSVIGQTTVVIS